MSKVVLVRCESYQEEEVRAAVEKGLELLGGVEQFARRGEKILLKPNLVAADPPDRCSTTHPSVFSAVARAFLDIGCNVSYGDSPGIHQPDTAARRAGFEAVASRLGIALADFRNGTEAALSEGIQNKKFVIARSVLECDGLVSLPKLKAHGLFRMTGAIKNQFGCIPGPLKGEYHVKLPDINDFARLLVDLNRFIKPRLYVMDGIMAMEGNGPRSGNPKKIGVLLFSSDPVALDATACRIIGLKPEFVPTIKIGNEAGLGVFKEEETELLGDDLESFLDSSFKVVREPAAAFHSNAAFSALKRILVPKPLINKSKCLRCGVCVNMCPVTPRALNWRGEKKGDVPLYNYKRCIRCYCCQEMCPEGAVVLKVPLLRKLINRILWG